MAKELMKARNKKRVELYKKWEAKIERVNAELEQGNISADEAAAKIKKIQEKRPHNSRKVRLHNTCILTGRPKGYMRQFGISRVTFREMANKGLIPGVTKASW